MQYKALVSFSGSISMASGQVAEIADEPLAKDLLNAGYIIPLVADEKPKAEKPKEEKPKKTTTPKKTTKRKEKVNED